MRSGWCPSEAMSWVAEGSVGNPTVFVPVAVADCAEVCVGVGCTAPGADAADDCVLPGDAAAGGLTSAVKDPVRGGPAGDGAEAAGVCAACWVVSGLRPWMSMIRR